MGQWLLEDGAVAVLTDRSHLLCDASSAQGRRVHRRVGSATYSLVMNGDAQPVMYLTGQAPRALAPARPQADHEHRLHQKRRFLLGSKRRLVQNRPFRMEVSEVRINPHLRVRQI